METAFQVDAFQNDAFQIAAEGPQYSYVHDPLELLGDWIAERIVRNRQ